MTLSSFAVFLTFQRKRKGKKRDKKKESDGDIAFLRRLTMGKRDGRTRPKDLTQAMPLKRDRQSFLSRTCFEKGKVSSLRCGETNCKRRAFYCFSTK
ncbi:hypothetical protein TNCT_504061 [Trichonephila clavata]|uniref:Uncharacterized protein n=1 Tax=Trichonephila clavata TaxID=2740835 RepID=A0A8X6IHA9_TRICU|nr:hypothetical protein TNCT_504061 [Trichonephila clavata]